MNEIRKFPLRHLKSARLLGALLTIAIAWTPITASSSVVIFGNDFDISSGTGGTVISIFPDVAHTPPGGPGPIPIPYPVINTVSTDSSTKQIKTTTMVIIKSERFRASTGDEPGVRNGENSINNLGLVGDTVQFSWDNFVHSEETASLSILVADPATGLPLDPDYSVEVTDSQSGSATFDITSIPLTVFDIILIAVQTTTEPQPRSMLSLTDIAIDDVSVADRFSVAVIPVPPALLLFVTGLLGLKFAYRRRVSGNT